MDSIDRRLIALVQADARLGYQELGEAVGLSAPAAYQRMRKLEANGVITGYYARVDAAKLGRDLVAFLRVVPGERTDTRRLEQRWAKAEEVLECHRVTGVGDYLLKLRLRKASDVVPPLDAARRAGCAASVEVGLSSVFERWAVPTGDGGERRGTARDGLFQRREDPRPANRG